MVSGAGRPGADWFEYYILRSYADEHVGPYGFMTYTQQLHPARFDCHESIRGMSTTTGND